MCQWVNFTNSPINLSISPLMSFNLLRLISRNHLNNESVKIYLKLQVAIDKKISDCSTENRTQPLQFRMAHAFQALPCHRKRSNFTIIFYWRILSHILEVHWSGSIITWSRSPIRRCQVTIVISSCRPRLRWIVLICEKRSRLELEAYYCEIGTRPRAPSAYSGAQLLRTHRCTYTIGTRSYFYSHDRATCAAGLDS